MERDPPISPDALPARPGEQLARGVARLLTTMGHAALTEFVPAGGLRVDVISITPKGEIWVVECKSCRADYVADRKWQGYLEFCDRFFWAVDAGFPDEMLPDGTGLIRADPWGAELIRAAPEQIDRHILGQSDRGIQVDRRPFDMQAAIRARAQ